MIDSTFGYGVSSHQFIVMCGKEMVNFYYYPDEITCRSKSNFEATLTRLIQEHDDKEINDFQWIEHYKREDLLTLADIDPNVAGGKVLPKNREAKFRDELNRRKHEYTVNEPYKIYTASKLKTSLL